MVLFISQFQPRLVNALEGYPNNPGKIRSSGGCNSKIVLEVITLVSLDNWVQVLAHEAWKRRHRSAKTFWKFFVGKSSGSKNECTHFR